MNGIVQSGGTIQGTVQTKATLSSAQAGITVYRSDYAFEEGDLDGTFRVLPTGMEPYLVKVHGLRDIAFSGDVADLTQAQPLVIDCGTAVEQGVNT